MSISNDIWQSVQSGDLEPYCKLGFPMMQTFRAVFWEQYVAGGNAKWEDYLPALNELVDQGRLTVSDNGWYNLTSYKLLR